MMWFRQIGKHEMLHATEFEITFPDHFREFMKLKTFDRGLRTTCGRTRVDVSKPVDEPSMLDSVCSECALIIAHEALK